MTYVKNTMIDQMLAFVAPHLCSGCGKTGSVLCDHCKYDIINTEFYGCLVCESVSETGMCPEHEMAYSQAWIVGLRQGVLQHLIGGFKFQNMKAAAYSLAELLNARLPSLPSETVVIPVPTSPAHIRERGYDHILLIAQHFATTRHLQLDTRLVGRRHTKTQHSANRNERIEQAKTAFSINGNVNPKVPYLIIDDVMTTGSTIQGVAKALSDGGARTIWVGVLARQPLD